MHTYVIQIAQPGLRLQEFMIRLEYEYDFKYYSLFAFVASLTGLIGDKKIRESKSRSIKKTFIT
jgi:hypothetical protein